MKPALPPPARYLCGIATGLIAISSLAACAGTSGDHPAAAAPVAAAVQPASQPATGQPGGDRGLTLPIEAYLIKGPQLNALNQAGSTLVSRCMATFGFDYQQTPSQAPVNSGQMTRRYGIMDPAAARLYGYHPAPADGIRAKQVTPQLNLASPTVPSTEVLALTGRSPSGTGGLVPAKASAVNGRAIPAGGCEGQSQRAVNGGNGTTLARWQGLVDQVNDAGFAASERDSRVQAGIADWSACMRGKGYSFPDPLAAVGSADLSQAQPSRQEIATAVADITCKQQTNLIATWHQVESGYETSQIKKDAATLAAVRASFTSRVQWAQAFEKEGAR